jgi:hypothetical protein
MSAIFHLNDDHVLEYKRKNIDDDNHDHDWFDESEAIDANVQKFIDDVIDSSFEIRFDKHDVACLNIMFSILLIFCAEMKMKV